MASPTDEVRDYYATIFDGENVFEDFDNENVYERLASKARTLASLNFVLDFSMEEAWCAFDLTFDQHARLLNTERPKALATRWINIWGPDLQKDTVEALARQYDFSPRLTGLMCSDARTKHRPKCRDNNPNHLSRTSSMKSMKSRFNMSMHGDPEKGAVASYHPPANKQYDLLESLNHYDVVDSIWHWSSVDLGKKYVCLGYNGLFNIDTSNPPSDVNDARLDLPNGERVWSWLILCNDQTVISMTERKTDDGERQYPGKNAVSTRRNMLNVFGQLSMATNPASHNPISLAPIRYTMGDTSTSVSSHLEVDGPGLLFYYLFDDWYASYSLVAKKGHQYGAELNKLRVSMMSQAKLSHVNQLHHIGRQLATLKRLYQSYDLVITRVLDKQRMPPKDCSSLCSIPSATDETQLALLPNGSTYDQLGIYLTSATRVRFERLRDRIQLYALTEIQESIDLKESLVMMNFNLITIKESDAVERLTRITILLAKATILFLPVSLMTAYFSTQLDQSPFSVASYWASFAVIFVVTFLGLVLFGKASGTVEGEMVYKSLWRVFLDLFKSRDRRKEE